MNSAYYAMLLILFLLIIDYLRVYFLKYGTLDSLSILSPICVILSILLFLSWGLSTLSLIIFLLSLITFLINFRSLSRFLSALYVDNYSTPLKVASSLLLLLALALFFLILLFLPYPTKTFQSSVVNSGDISVTRTNYKGSITAGFTFSTPFIPPNLTITTYQRVLQDPSTDTIDEINKVDAVDTVDKEDSASSSPLPSIIVLPDKTASPLEYSPYMILLAKKGFKVYSASFYTKDLRYLHNIADSFILRKFIMRAIYIVNQNTLSSEAEFYSYNLLQELNYLASYVAEKGEHYFIIADKMSLTMLEDYNKTHTEDPAFLGSFNLSSFSEYKTAGLGFIANTDPLFYSYLSFFTPLLNKTQTPLPLTIENIRAIRKERSSDNLTSLVEKTTSLIQTILTNKEDANKIGEDTNKIDTN